MARLKLKRKIRAEQSGMNKLRGKYIALDTETTGLIPYGPCKHWGFYPARPFAFSFCDWYGNKAYIRWEVDPKTRRVIQEKKTAKMIQDLLDKKGVVIIFHNASYDLKMIQFSGFEIRGKYHDTMIMAHVVTGGSEFTYALKPITDKFFDFPQQDQKDLIESVRSAWKQNKKVHPEWKFADKAFQGRQPVQADYWMGNRRLCKKYAVQDAVRTMLLYQFLIKKLNKDKVLKDVYRREMRLLPVLEKMELKGMMVRKEKVLELIEYYENYMKKQLRKANKEGGGKDLNFRSHKQLVNVFFEIRKHKPEFFTPGGAPKMDSKVLGRLAEKDKLAKAILEYRTAAHAISGFLEPYTRFWVPEDGLMVLHPNFRQVGTVTGRLSCSDPNLMTVSSASTGRRRSDVVERPREAFGPRPGTVWYLPDYSQIEVWLFSFMSGEKGMQKALMSGYDFHGSVANDVWGKEQNFKERYKYWRKRAKIVMFCKLYGGGAKAASRLLECSVEEAEDFISKFDMRFPGVNRFQRRMINRANRQGFVRNKFGRIYYLHHSQSYRAVNYLIQGTAADILKNALYYVDKMLKEKWPGCSLLLPLHDEICVEVPLEYHSKRLMREVIFEMQRDSDRVGVPKPLPVGMKICKTHWDETTEIENV